ncbi:MAG: response regulator [Candidatus Zixiibacteriota bacterium]|nr:MAG: response regulator [candidate division Zixibacteria bacterium]
MLKKDSLKPAASVLLVEDSDDVRDFVSEILTGEGFSVSTARNGLSAWSLISSRYFDLVISDMGLPDMDGEELLRNMRRNSIGTPVLLISGVRINEAKESGFPDSQLIYKPFEVNEIKKAIFDLLNQNNSAPN